MDLKPLQKELTACVRKLSYREGDFTLASGKQSKFYVDLKVTTLHPEGARLIGKLGVAMLKNEYPAIHAVGGLTLGADPIATALSLAAAAEGIFWPAYIVRKESKGHGTGRYIEGIENLRPGARVVVLEDVVTTGGSSIIAVQRLREAGFDPALVLTVVDREQGGAEAITKLGLRYVAMTTLAEVQRSGG